MRFLDDHRVLATGVWYENQVSPVFSNSWMLDVAAGTVLEPPKAFADFADASFSDNGLYANLRDSRGRAQLWQVNPWKPLSGLSEVDESALPWMVDPRGRFAASLTNSMARLRLHRVADFAAPVMVPWL